MVRSKSALLASLTFILCLSLTSCGDECSSYSDFSCKEIEKADYNVMFNFPDDDEVYNIGRASGLAACGNLARAYAFEKKVQDENWGYVCCMIAKGSSCYEKHR